MLKLLTDNLPRILKNKKKLEELLKVKISNRGREIELVGASEQEFLSEKVIRALEIGFPFSEVLNLIDEEATFETIHIKDHTTKADLKRIRARIIGANGKTIKTISDLTKCALEIKDNTIGIIGELEYIKNAIAAIISLIKGTKQGNVYAYLEKHQIKPEEDLGLREKGKD